MQLATALVKLAFCESLVFTLFDALLIHLREMTVPGVPVIIPDEISALTSLTRLTITGDRNLPGGRLRDTLPPSLRTLELFNTYIDGPIAEALFEQGGPLSQLTTLTLDGNTAMGPSIPAAVSNLALESLLVELLI